MAIEIKDVRTVTLTGEDQFAAQVRVKLLVDGPMLIVDTLRFIRAGTEGVRIGRSVRLEGNRLDGNSTTEVRGTGSLMLAELPPRIVHLLTDDDPGA